jgi:hypothetical protein
MTYAAAPAATPKPRPGTVTLAIWLMYLYVLLQVIGIAVVLASLSNLQDAYRTAFKDSTTTTPEAAATIATVSVVVAVVLGLLIAAGLVVLAIFNGKGKNPARIVTWVLCGIAICCGGINLISSVAGSSMNFGGGGNGAPSQSEIANAVKNAMPSWYLPTVTAVGLIGLAVVIAVVVLLALPASNDFFRKQQEPVWEPPVQPPA